jgi:hypothetical protein
VLLLSLIWLRMQSEILGQELLGSAEFSQKLLNLPKLRLNLLTVCTSLQAGNDMITPHMVGNIVIKSRGRTCCGLGPAHAGFSWSVPVTRGPC